ncbi:MAG: orotate phosphoribosyltransferase [Bacteroidota bacterium]|nr:orotate phosphoribosyltransferase [Bacteroidota bacterium]
MDANPATPLTEEQALQLFRDAGAFLEGHFLLTSGLHSPHYVEKFRVLERPHMTSLLCGRIADEYRAAGVTVVLGPATGGIILAHETARQLGVRVMFTERVEGAMVLRRGFSLSPADRVLLVEDVITTGGSVRELIELVRETGAGIVALAFLVDRSGGRARFDVPSRPLITLDVVTYEPDQCPLCRQGVPLVKPGRTGKI